MKQGLLFDVEPETKTPSTIDTLTHRGDPETSREAARKLMAAGKLGLHRQIVLDGVKCCPGGTHSEIAAGTPLDWLQVARRLSELERAGLVRKGEPRICRVKGSRCTTWWTTQGAG